MVIATQKNTLLIKFFLYSIINPIDKRPIQTHNYITNHIQFPKHLRVCVILLNARIQFALPKVGHLQSNIHEVTT